MRIIVIVSFYKPAYVYGGPVRSISAMCEALAGLGQEVTVLTTNANGDKCLDVPLREPVYLEGVQVFYYPINETFFLHSFFYSPDLLHAFRQQVLNHDIAVLETFQTYTMAPAVEICNRSNVPCVVPIRGQLLPWALRHRRWKKILYMNLGGRKALNRSSAIQCSTVQEAQQLAQLRLKPPVYIIPNGIDTARYIQLPTRGALRKRLGIQDMDKVILFLGRLHRVKNPELALNILIALNRKDVHLVYVGPDAEKFQPRLMAHADQAGCSGQVHFTGLLTGDDLMQVFSDSDLLLMPSAMESFGMAAIEALAAGLPVVVSNNVPIGLFIMQAGAGQVVPCTVYDFQTVISDLLSSPEELKIMGGCGRDLVRQKFDIRVVARQMLSQYESIISTGHPRY